MMDLIMEQPNQEKFENGMQKILNYAGNKQDILVLRVQGKQSSVSDFTNLKCIGDYENINKLHLEFTDGLLQSQQILDTFPYDKLNDNNKIEEFTFVFKDNQIKDLEFIQKILKQLKVLKRLTLDLSDDMQCSGKIVNFQDGQFLLFGDDQCTIKQCDNICKRCRHKSDECTECGGENLPIEIMPYCITQEDCQQKESYFIDNENHICQKCFDKCTQCTSTTDCQSCEDKFFAHLQKECLPCLPQCKICKDGDTCETCLGTFKVSFKKKCVDDCGEKAFAKEGICQHCSDMCDKCQNREICDTCQHGTKYIEKQNATLLECTNKCPTEFYYQEENTCKQCMNQCFQCKNNYECEQCQFGYYIDDSKNFVSCQLCKVDNCKLCQEQGQVCSSCWNSTFLDTNKNECVPQCPETYFGDGETGVCDSCNDKCQVCEGDKDHCTKCKGEFWFVQKSFECVSECYPKTYKFIDEFDNKLCKVCSAKCQECKEKATHCTKCNSVGQYLYSNSCFDCDNSCFACNGGSITDCTQCKGDNLLQEGQCVVTCDKGYEKNGRVCLKKKHGDSFPFWVILIIVVVLIVVIMVLVYYVKRNSDSIKQQQGISLQQQSLGDSLVNSQDYEKKNSGQNKNLDSFDTAKYNSNETSSYLTKKYQDNLALVDTTPQQFETNYYTFNLYTKVQFQAMYLRQLRLGEGTYAVVDQYLQVKSNRRVAIKKLKFSDNDLFIQEGLKEAKFLQALNKRSQYVIKIEDFFLVESKHENQVRRKLVMVFELAEQSLDDYINNYRQKYQKIEEQEVVKIINQLAKGMLVLHNDYKMSHRDIKPRNILYCNKWKLGDFGGAKVIEHASKMATSKHTLVGTLVYLSPEQKKNFLNPSRTSVDAINTFKGDVFAFGVLCYELITLQYPNGLNNSQMECQSIVQQTLLRQNHVHEDILQLVANMLKWEPDDRITFKEIIEFFQNFNNNNSNFKSKGKNK